MAAVGILFGIAGIILLLAGLGQSIQNKSFADAQVVRGTVIDKRKRDLKNGTAYELTISYKVDGIEYSKVIGVKLTEYKAISEGESFDLKYRPDKPHKSINPTALNSKTVRGVLLSGAIITGIGAVLVLVGFLTR